MRSQFLLGLIGLAIVMLFTLGGIIVALFLHQLVTPSLDSFLLIWIWIGLIPSWWLFTRVFSDDERFQNPVATYTGLLPFLLLLHVIMILFDPGDTWLWPVFAVFVLVYSKIAPRVRTRLFRRQHSANTASR